jgi:hypothetical protein
MANAEGIDQMRNAEHVAYFDFVILASSLIRHSCFGISQFMSTCHVVALAKADL